MKDVTTGGTSNVLLNGLNEEERERLSPHLTYHQTTLGETLYQPNATIDYLFFPNNSMASVLGHTKQGSSAEIGIIGKEGVVGADLLLGADRMVNHVIVQLSDGGFRLPAAEAIREFSRCGPFHANVLHFVYRLMIQISQTAVCNALHGLEERLARWLLMSHDRSSDDTLHMTQEFLSFMVGTTRASVTLAAITLQDLGYISYKRGAITIVDRPSLIDFSCDCYRVVNSIIMPKN